MGKGRGLLLHVREPGPAGRSLERGRPSPTQAVAAELGGAALNPKAEASPPYCGEWGGRLAAVALGFGLRRSLAPPAVNTVNRQGAAATSPLSFSSILFLHCFSLTVSPLPPQFLVVHLLI